MEKSPPEEQMSIEGDILDQLVTVMQSQGYTIQDPSQGYNESIQEVLRQFIGVENFEERVDVEKGLIDAPVFEFLIQKFG
jgi:hypothetical protein